MEQQRQKSNSLKKETMTMTQREKEKSKVEGGKAGAQKVYKKVEEERRVEKRNDINELRLCNVYNGKRRIETSGKNKNV